MIDQLKVIVGPFLNQVLPEGGISDLVLIYLNGDNI